MIWHYRHSNPTIILKVKLYVAIILNIVDIYFLTTVRARNIAMFEGIS